MTPLSAAAVFLLLALHPFFFYFVSLVVLRRLRNSPSVRPHVLSEEVVPKFAVCVCAYNESAVIRQKVENLKALRAATGPIEILIYVDGATDDTAAILREYDSELTLVIATERKGKSFGMNRLVSLATAPIVVFSDANVMMDADALNNLEKYFADPSVGCVCGHLGYINPDDSTTAEIGSLYWRLEEKVKQLESDVFSVMGADGSVFAIRRDLHVPVPPDIIDDFYVSMSILCNGYRVIRAPDVRAWEKSVASSQEEFRRKIRIACQAFNVHRLLWPRLRQQSGLVRYMYLSHKFLRWIAGYNLAIAALLALSGLAGLIGWTPTLILSLSGAILFAVACRLRVKSAERIAEILMALAATAIGVLRSLRGERFQTWQPAASIRAAAAPLPSGSLEKH